AAAKMEVINAGVGSRAGIGGNWGGSAAGGPIPGGVPRWVGERGKELIVPMVDSFVVPHVESTALLAQSARFGSLNEVVGQGGDTNINVTLLDRMEVHSVADIASATKMLRRRGYFGPS